MVPDRRSHADRAPQERRSANRRAFPRWPANFHVRYSWQGQTVEARPVEISEGGFSVDADIVPEVSSELTVEYRLPGEDWVELKARTTHTNGQRVGFEFLSLRRADRLKILDHITAKPS